MNKRGLIKASVLSILILFLIILSISILSTTPSLAIIPSNSYILGEKVKINLEGIENYKLKIITPSTTYIKEGSKDIFIFKPEESGLYKIILQYEGKNQIYDFEVISNIYIPVDCIIKERECIDRDSTTKCNLIMGNLCKLINESQNLSNNQTNKKLNDENSEVNSNSAIEEQKDIIETERIKKIPVDLEVFSTGEEPNFDLDYHHAAPVNPNASQFGRFVNKIKDVVRRDGVEAAIYDANDKKIEAKINVEKTNQGFEIDVEKTRTVKPGLNRIELKVKENGQESILEKWFLWGVLTINTEKSIYLPEETAFLSFGVLNDAGSVVCDADLTLEITSPNEKKEVLSTENSKIIKNRQCGFLGVVSQPDYFAYYKTYEKGNYSMVLTAETENGIYIIENSFEVREYVSFDVKRLGPTRIYPKVDNQMKFRIKANENYIGKIFEKVPETFKITLQPDMKIKNKDGEKILSWDVEFIAGNEYEFFYELDAPDESPALYSLGPLEIGNFKEIRSWQIANDAETTIDASVAAPQEQYAAGASVVFINDTTGYAFYFDVGPALSYKKTNDQGSSWGSPVTLTSQTDAYTFAIWYDRYTPNDNGTLIHIVFGETGTDSFFYLYLNTTGDTLRSEVDATGDIGRLREQAQNPYIVKSSAGNLFFSGRDDQAGTGDIWKSTNNGSNWNTTGASSFNTDFNDEFVLMPMTNSDVMAIQADDSAADLLYRIYNETNDTWMSPSTINLSFEVSTTASIESSWGATLDKQNGYIYLVGNNNPAILGGAIISYFYTGTTWIQKADVNSTIGTSGRGSKVSFDSNNGAVYATYTRAPSGTLTSSNVYYVSSTNNMSSWSAETQLSTTTDDLMHAKPDLMNNDVIYTVWLNNGLNDFMGGTIVDLGASEIQDISGNIFSTTTDTSISIAPLDYNRFVLGWCDDTNDKIKVAIYYTNGTGIKRDVDTTAGACVQTSAGQSVSVTALKNNEFVIGWYDSVDSDITFKVFYTNLTNITGDIDVDTTAGTSAAVSVSAFNSTAFAIGWYDQIDEDSTFQVYSSSGTSLYGPFDADTTVDVDSNSVDISAMNSTSLVFAWFDSIGNDIIFQTFTINGTPISSVTADAAAGVSRAVSVTAVNSTEFVLAWSDQNTNDATYRVYYINGTPLTAETDVDTDIGTSRSVSVSATSQEDFVYSWYDASTDIGISTQTFLLNTTQISSEIVVQSNSQQYQHVASEEAATQIQLCENAYVVALSNTTSQSFWRSYYQNGTVWSGVCPTYFPVISGVNATSITITNATIIWNTNVKTNSTINYGTTLSLGASLGQNFPKLNHSFILSSLTGSTTYYYNATSCIDGRCNTTGAFNFTTSESDTTPPSINLILPINNSNITTGFDFEFVYNVSDLSTVSNCTIFVDGTAKQTKTSITQNTNQTFHEYMNNGTHLWSVLCRDEFNNLNITQNRTVNAYVSSLDFQRRFYETFTSNFATNQTAIIKLNNSRDSTQNDVTFNIVAQTRVNVFNATTQFIGANGALIPSNSIIDFSASFSATAAAVEATWKIYITNSSGITLLCQNGDDGSGGIPINVGTISSSNTTCINKDIRLQSSDRILLLMNAFNTHATAGRTITHAWDAATASQVDINITTEGFLNVNLSSPVSDPNVASEATFNASCQVSCSIGTCRNTQVYIQQNTSALAWSNINATSGNLILNTGETNPHSVGNISTSTITTNFTLQGNAVSANNIRCRAVSSYDEINGSSLQITVGGAAATAPTVILTNPANATWFNTSQAILYYNASDINNNLANSTLILNGLKNQTNQSSLLNGQINNFTITLTDGVYTWTVNATDTTNLEGTNSSIRTFYVDTIKPSINLTSPSIDQIFQVSTVEFNFTATDNMDNIMVCNLTIDSTVRGSNFNANNGSNTNRTITPISIGMHLWNVTCADEAGNKNTSLTRNFTIQDLPPTIDLITANNSFTNTGNITLIYNATDNNGFIQSQLILNGLINQTNQSAILNGQYNNFSLTNLAEGIYTWNVNVTDTSSLNATNSSRTFTIDKSSPNVTLNLPSNNTISNSSTVNFNFTVIDNLDTSLTCNLTVGERQDNGFSATNGSLTNRQLTSFTDEGRYWNVTCVDDAGNTNISQNRFINITEYPRISLNTANNSFFNISSFNLSYTPSDNTNLSICNLFIDGAFNQTNQSQIRNNLQNNFSLSRVPEGLHNWYVSCNDTINLQNSSENRTFTVDLDGLNVTLIYPPNGASLFSLTLNFSFNASDNIDPALVCNITANSVVVNTSLVTSGLITNRTVTFASGGTKIWNVTCEDDSGNRVTSSTRNVSLESPPTVTLNSPSNNTFRNISITDFFYDVSDTNNNLANATFILNGRRNQTNQSALVNDATNNFTLNLPDGIYNWTINVTDLTNLEGTGSPFRVLTIDTKAPLITLNSPSNNTQFTTNNVSFNFTISDNIDLDISCDLNVDDTPTITKNYTNGSTNVEYVIRGDGNYTWSVDCTDDSSNNNQTETRTFNIEAPPNVTLQSPNNENITNINNISFIYLPQDTIGINNCSLFIDNIINTSSASITNNVNNTFSVNNILEGKHNWTVACTDVFPDFNLFTAPIRNFTVDITPPAITLNSPSNNSNILRNVTFNFSASDNLDGDNILSCNLYIDNSLNQSNINVTNGASITRTVSGHSLGIHNWNVTCIDDANNRNWSVKLQYNVTLADLMVNSSSISFNTTSPTENETVLINATIYNLINVSVSNIIVQFFKGDPDSGGTQIGANQTISSISPLGQQTASVNWQAELGTNYIFVIVDPPLATNGSIEEWLENNNKANNSITTGAWQFVYGDVNSDSFFDLADVENKSVIRWESVNFNSGNIFVIDSESSILWTSTLAIGKNTTGSNTSNDFSDIDTLLNMTGFPDSVSTLYTNSSGTIINTTNYIVFNKVINFVPITNSTNNTNFYTGILWDSSDNNNSNNGEFDTTDKEDLIFAAQLNKDKQGAYGTYDYEIRIPANIRRYSTTDSNSVVFYTEIK